MSRKLFHHARNILAEIRQMETDENPRREDRVIVAEFFHGRPPISDAQAEALGLTINGNQLFGYEHMAASKDQLLALYTAPPRLWEIKLDRAPGHLKQKWEELASQEWNRIMKASGRLKHGYEFVAGDATMHGEGFFWNRDPFDWCPRHVPLSRRLVPSNASLDLRELTHFAIEADLSFQDVVKFAKQGGKGWNRANLNRIVDRIFRQTKDQDGLADVRMQMETTNVESMAYHRQANAGFDNMWKFKVPVVYFYQVNFDDPQFSYDLTIISRYALANLNREGDAAGEAVLFEREKFIPSILDAMFPLHMNCAIGGEALWHRVKPLGHLNYGLSWHLEMLFNRALQSAHEQNTTFYQAADSAAREAMEQILLKHNGIIPENIQMVQNKVGGDFRGLLSLVQLIRTQGSTNANQMAPQTPDTPRDLEVNALFKQNTIGTNATNRITNWFDYMNRLGAKVLARFTRQFLPGEKEMAKLSPGWSEIMDFHGAMQRHGIPLTALQPSNVRVITARVAGDGIRQQALAGAQALMQNIQIYGPEAQQEIKRMFTGAVTNDYSLAERLVPIQETPDHTQVLRAETENNVFAAQGKVMPLDDADNDSVHIQSHFDFMGRLVQKGMQEQQQSFTPDQLNAFKAAGAHTYAHIERIAPLNKEVAAQANDILNELSAMAQKLANNLQQQMQSQQEPVDPIKVAQVQLAEKKQALAERKQEANENFRERTQALRERQAATQEVATLSRENREEKMSRQEMALADADMALKITQPLAQPVGAE